VAGEAVSGPKFEPMHQFGIHPLFGGDTLNWYTPSNVTLWMGVATLAAVALFVLGTSRRALVPGRSQSVAEILYSFVHDMVVDITGHDGVKYFPYVMTLFTFILFSNYLGLIPGAFTTTSHIAVTAIMAMAVFLTVTIMGFVLNGVKFLGMFWVSSAPLALRPILAVIELMSYFVRPMSHSIRLAGNMMAGHTVINVFATFGFYAIISPLSVIGIAAMLGFEVLVCAIQAYVFTILTCVYLRDALHPHH
jgi:F-type H+-transporting ATPase subunit a